MSISNVDNDVLEVSSDETTISVSQSPQAEDPTVNIGAEEKKKKKNRRKKRTRKQKQLLLQQQMLQQNGKCTCECHSDLAAALARLAAQATATDEATEGNGT